MAIKILSLTYDFLVFGFLGLSLFGGIEIGGQLYLKHGPDTRRAAMILFVLGYLSPWILRRSFSFQAQSRRLWESSYALRLFQSIKNFMFDPKGYKNTLIGLVGTTAILAIVRAVMQALACRFTMFDVGIFHQLLWCINHGFAFFSTISGAGNFLMDHFSPSLAVLAPLFRVSDSSPFFLPIVTVLLVYTGMLAWIYLAFQLVGPGKNLFQRQFVVAVTVFVVTFDSAWKNMRWGFHENTLAFAASSWAFALLFIRILKPNQKRSALGSEFVIIALLLITGLSKEILLLNSAGVCLVWAGYLWFTHPWGRLKNGQSFPKSVVRFPHFVSAGLLVALLLLLSMAQVIGFLYFESLSHPSNKNYFIRYYSYLGTDLNGFFHTLIFAPWKIIQAVGLGQLLSYFWTVFSPWIFIPFLVVIAALLQKLQKRRDTSRLKNPIFKAFFKKAFVKNLIFKEGVWVCVIALAGMIFSYLSSALSTFPYLRKPEYHYVMELWPALACATIVILFHLQSKALLWIWVFFNLMRANSDPLTDIKDYMNPAWELQSFRTELQSIPLDHVVIAYDLAGPWISGRRWINLWPNTALLPRPCPDDLIIKDFEEPEIPNVLKECLDAYPSAQVRWVSTNGSQYGSGVGAPQGAWLHYQIQY